MTAKTIVRTIIVIYTAMILHSSIKDNSLSEVSLKVGGIVLNATFEP